MTGYFATIDPRFTGRMALALLIFGTFAIALYLSRK